MSLRDQLRDSLNKDGKPDKGGLWHSKAYHRFFEGYSEIEVPTPDGKGTRIQRVYTGNYYRQDLPPRRQALLRLLYGLLIAGTAYLFISSAVQPLASNSTWYVVLGQVACIPFLFWLASAFLSSLLAERDMTIHDYRSTSLALQKAALGSAAGLGLAALLTLVFLLQHLPDQPLLVLLCAGKYLAAGGLALAVNRVEKRVKYVQIPSPDQPPAAASAIQ